MKQEVYREEEDMGKSSISVRWVLSRKLKMGKISFKQDFAQGVLRRSKTSPLTLHVARESVFRLFILITSNQ